MQTIQTQLLSPNSLSPHDNLQVYCGLDTMVTLEVRHVLGAIPHHAQHVYAFERALQGPYMEIMQRGMLVDLQARNVAAQELREERDSLAGILAQFTVACCGRVINPNSPLQLQQLFYRDMSLPEVWLNMKGERKLSTNREALEKLYQYLPARPIINCILGIRDITKQLEVLENGIDPDSRFRSSYNIAGTETGRPSSSSNAFGTGRNAQNISPNLRFPFIADPGKRMAVVDLEQVEARDVGFFCGCLFDDWKFLDACESGDLHTANARLIWPGMGWTGDRARDREIADQQFYREFSFRDMAKRGSHLSNYSGTAWMAARALKVPLEIMQDFQSRYIRGPEAAYPCIARWWQWTATQLQTRGYLVTPFGRVRHFFGRHDDPTTLREAIANLPQSTTADRMNLGMLRVWQAMPQVELLGQTYDSITFQYDEREDEGAILAQVLDLIKIELVAPNGRKYVVPGDAKVGWNWGACVTREDQDRARVRGLPVPRLNLEGLVKWKPGFKDQRKRRVGLNKLLY